MSSAICGSGGAIAVTAFLSHFKDMPDPRQAAKVTYPLQEILLLVLVSVLAGAEGFTDAAHYGKAKLAFLRRFLPFANGTPAHDHLGDVFASLDPAAFAKRFAQWAAELTGTPVDAIAIDGKTSRRSGPKASQELLHTVSAFAASERLVLGQLKTDAKSNEITAIPELLALIALEGAVVTIDAMGCQRGIAQTILDRKADYVLALKGNRGAMFHSVKRYVKKHDELGYSGHGALVHETRETSHGREEMRRVRVVDDVAWIARLYPWPGLKSVIVVQCERKEREAAAGETQTRLYLASAVWPPDRAADLVRGHWGVENSLHWVMDMVFGDDQCRVRTGHAAQNFVAVKHVAANFARRNKGKESLRLTLKTAAWDDDHLAKLLAA